MDSAASREIERRCITIAVLTSPSADASRAIAKAGKSKEGKSQVGKVPAAKVWRDDVTCLSAQLQPDSFDLILCSHVLEHVPDDRTAMKELFRVLAPGGMAILMVPIALERATTDEDPSVIDPHERIKRFGQFDHVRLYGRDYVDRLRAAGFEVIEDAMTARMDAETVFRYGLLRSEVVHAGTKK